MGTASSSSVSHAPDLLVSVNGCQTLLRSAAGPLVIGREIMSGGIQLDHPAISRVHARLEPGPRWRIVDYESRNGLYVNGYRIHHAVIADSMEVQFGAPGGVTVTFRYAGDQTDNMSRVGRAVARRSAQLGLSRHDLELHAKIDGTLLDNVLNGRIWPSESICDALDQALSWPAGSLLTIGEGTPPEDITDVIAPAGPPPCPARRGGSVYEL